MEAAEYQAMAALEEHFWWYRAMHRAASARLERYVPADNLHRLLDAGCGTGGFLRHWQQMRNTQAVGVDFCDAACNNAKQITRYPIVQGSVDALPFAEQSFDVITSHDVLYHRAVNEAAALNEWQRCLRPGGYLSVQVAAYEWLRSAHDEQVHGARRYTETQLTNRLKQHGFEIVASGYWNSLLFPVMAITRLLNKKEQHSDVKPLPAVLNNCLYQILDTERRIQLRLPFGGTTWAIARNKQ